jgi:hypothetical protein
MRSWPIRGELVARSGGALGGRLEPSAGLLRELDGDPSRRRT